MRGGESTRSNNIRRNLAGQPRVRSALSLARLGSAVKSTMGDFDYPGGSDHVLPAQCDASPLAPRG
jgi:hypothetical protein